MSAKQTKQVVSFRLKLEPSSMSRLNSVDACRTRAGIEGGGRESASATGSGSRVPTLESKEGDVAEELLVALAETQELVLALALI
jgi:hypothetical protein